MKSVALRATVSRLPSASGPGPRTMRARGCAAPSPSPGSRPSRTACRRKSTNGRLTAATEYYRGSMRGVAPS